MITVTKVWSPSAWYIGITLSWGKGWFYADIGLGPLSFYIHNL